MSDDIIIIGKSCKISKSAVIKSGSIIGKKYRRLLTGEFDEKDYSTKIDTNVYVGYMCIIGNGSSIGSNSILDDKSVVECDVIIGKKTLLIYSAQVCNSARIGNDCIIGGLIGERATIHNNCRVFGKIVHSQTQPLNGWDDETSEEKAPLIRNNVFIGFNSIVVGEVELGPNSYIMAGSIITKPVPPFHIAHGYNQVVHYSRWKGKLKDSNLFK